ncbi:hypothetical protein [Streptomyces sp. NBC_01465]|uniref:hypothetical protein n=1 Tax=Streptomyces sp. NBC_01465 TaxID=2903878 RepID=UPI002E315B32|nr:hypothetical protein [Streptomyces sp. NBC_01465]
MSGLPRELAGWGAQLDALDAACAVALGPLVRGIDGLMGVGARADAQARLGEFDGYDGLSRAGTPERLVMSEWLLAEEAPEEFLRRAAEGELLHLAPARRAEEARGRVAVVVDCGPSQWGAGRLVQLAALMVAHRRAVARGSALVVGVLGRTPGEWAEGELPEVLRAWLGSRSAVEPDPVDVEKWLGALDAADEAWVLAGEPLAARLAGRSRVLVARESDWSGAGAAEVTVRVGGRSARLALPEPSAGVRILRGQGWKRAGATGAGAPVGGVGSMVFPGTGRQLVLRSQDDARQLITVRVPNGPGREHDVVPRRHGFPGPVVAAGYFGRRLVALVRVGDELRVQVVGKTWAAAEGYTTLAVVLGDATDRPLVPLVVEADSMLMHWGDDWIGMQWDLYAPVLVEKMVAALPGGATAKRLGDRLHLPHLPGGHWTVKDQHVVLGPGTAHVRSLDGQLWRFVDDVGTSYTQRVPKSERPLGAVVLEGRVHLVVRSAAGHLLRIRGPVRNTVLTKWSDTPHPPALHPTLPLLAVRRESGAIEVVDLESGERLLNLRSVS